MRVCEIVPSHHQRTSALLRVWQLLRARGFGIRRGTKKMPSRFDNIDDARIAVDLFRARRGKQKHDPDYEEER